MKLKKKHGVKGYLKKTYFINYVKLDNFVIDRFNQGNNYKIAYFHNKKEMNKPYIKNTYNKLFKEKTNSEILIAKEVINFFDMHKTYLLFKFNIYFLNELKETSNDDGEIAVINDIILNLEFIESLSDMYYNLTICYR